MIVWVSGTAACLAALGLAAAAEPAGANVRWSEEKSWAWYRDRPWTLGFNFVPSTACNTTEFWGAQTFDETTIEREVTWAAGHALAWRTTLTDGSAST